MGSVFPVLDAIAVALRFYAKHKVQRIGLDDFLVVISLVCLICYIIGSFC